MSHEVSLRQKAVRWKQAGRSVNWICQQLERSREWFYKWWNRYQIEGASGLRDRSPAPKTNPQCWSNEIRQAILDIRDRLMRRRGPRERYRLAGAPTIRHELACLGYDPLPSLRTIVRILQAGGRTSPAFRTQPCTTSSSYPAVRVTHSNQRHQVDLIGPRYLKGSRRQWFFLVYRDIYDGAVFVEFQPKPQLETVLAFVVRAWQRLGLPNVLQVDNSDLFGLTSHPGSLNRFVRLALLVGVELTFIPEHEPWRNGSIEYFNGWLQERILIIPLHSPSQVRRELSAMMDTCFHEHIHPHLNFQTTAQVRKNLSPRTLPHTFRRHLEPLPVAIGRVTFLRRVRASGRITILGVKFKVGKRLVHQYVSAILYTRTMLLKIYSQGRLLKQFNFPFVGKLKL
jgi:transposase InsO family protein